MKLLDLEPRFVIYFTQVAKIKVVDGDPNTWRERGCPTQEKTVVQEVKRYVQTLTEAQGILFLCPKCFGPNGKIGCHYCEVTFDLPDVPDGIGTHNSAGNSVRWKVTGTNYADLSTMPSILVEGGCDWHGYITNGQVTTV